MDLPAQNAPRTPLSEEYFDSLLNQAKEAAEKLREQRTPTQKTSRTFADSGDPLVAPLKTEASERDLTTLLQEAAPTSGFLSHSQGHIQTQLQAEVVRRFGVEAGEVSWTEVPPTSGPSARLSFEVPVVPSGTLRTGTLFRVAGPSGELVLAGENPEPAREWVFVGDPAASPDLGDVTAGYEATLLGDRASFELTLRD